MATKDYNQILLDKGYTQAQIDAMRWAASSWGSQQDIVNAGKTNTSTTSTTSSNKSSTSSTNSTPTTYTTKSEYGGQGSNTSAQPKDTSWDKWNWTYSYNASTGYYEKTGGATSNNQTSNQTSTSAGTPSTPTTPTTSGGNKVQNWWNNLSPEEQQKYWNTDAGKQAMKQYWLTYKPQDTGTNAEDTSKGNETPKSWDGWDYQDNSPERMLQMANNVDQLYVTDPWLFTDEDTFRKFFIDWKGRTPEQEAFLMDYYKNRQTYNKYDTYASDEVWAMLAHWKVPQSYLNYLKNSNPDRYNAVMDAKDAEQDKISNNTYYDSLLDENWFESSTSTGSNLEWQKKEWLFVDENGDLIDDRRYHEPTEEEKTKVARINQIDARIMEIKNQKKNLLDDLVKQYPWVPTSTLMGIVNDRTDTLNREYDDLMVERTELAWSVEYLQSERQQQDQAGSDTINQLKSQYWMYYTYSPEWMSELAQAQYAAANPTLAEAENWTDTQKQMALDSILTGYYDKYGTIIERPKEQVIQDIMAYAKKNWVSLQQALKENFVDFLKAKPWYDQLNTDTSWISWGKIWEDADWNDVYWFIDLLNKTVTPYGDATTSWTAWTYDTSTRSWKQKTINQIVSYDWTDDLGSVVSDIYDQFKWEDYGECGYLVNDYYSAVTWDSNKLITWTFKDRKDLFTKSTPDAWDVVLFDWTGSDTASDKQKTYGHVGIVEWVDDTGIWIVDANWNWDWKVQRRHINYDDPLYQNRVYGFYQIPEDKRKTWSDAQASSTYYNPSDSAKWLYDEYIALTSWLVSTAAKQDRVNEITKLLWLSSEWELAEEARAYWKDKDAKSADKIVWMIDYLESLTLPDYNDRERYWTNNSYGKWQSKTDWDDKWYWVIWWNTKDEDIRQDYKDWAAAYDQLMSNLMFDKYQDVKSSWGTFGSMSNAEWDALKQAATNLRFDLSEDEYYRRLNELRTALKPFQDNGRSSTISSDWKQNTMSSLMWMFGSY